MYDAPGAGLASIQVGFDKSIVVYDGLPGETDRSLQVLLNPKIIESEGEILSENEGCLSVPDFRSDVKRSSIVLVEGIDREGNPNILRPLILLDYLPGQFLQQGLLRSVLHPT